MKTAEIRSAYLKFFEDRGHQHVASASLVPGNDPTLLFTNSGMVQFKDALRGSEDPGYSRATSAQRCVRAGGKHNDLENVGYTARHHTMFEMLGNFSFGDYFKQETITWAWQFVTEVLDLDKDRLWVTVHPSDDEARRIWVEDVGFDADRVIDLEGNFWAMGDTGPCGPCSEIFYDQGPEIEGGPPGSADEDGDRFLEFWNLVFPQFDRSADGTLTPLASPGVDTGLGLERVAAIKQNVQSTFEIDVFAAVMREAGQFAGINDEAEILAHPSVRVIADHIRAAAFLIADGVMPGNEDRDYVLRRIIRRALRHGYKLDITEPFFNRLVAPLAKEMGDAYPLLNEHRVLIESVLLREEQRFAETLSLGMEVLNRAIDGLDDKTIPGDVAFKLYDTFGFPVDLTADVARERGLELDMDGFDVAMEEQRNRARAASRFDASVEQTVHVDSNVEFRGYTDLATQAVVVGLYKLGDGSSDAEAASAPTEVTGLQDGERGIVILDRTPFYAEAGGQVGDAGELKFEGSTFRVDDTTKGGGQHLHRGILTAGAVAVGDTIEALVDEERRARIALNHSATHLLHAALREVLGPHVQQKGSLVQPDRLRFDFSHTQPVSDAELAEVTGIVNQRIRDNSDVITELTGYDQAIEKGAMALFGEKYGSDVRVLTMGDGFSVELCGGTHVRRTGDIGLLHITAETGIAAGVRRIEAVTGAGAEQWIDQSEQRLGEVANLVKGGRDEVVDKVRQLVEQSRQLQRDLATLQTQFAQSKSGDLAANAVDVGGVKVLGAAVEGDPKSLLTTLDSLKDQLGSAVIVLSHVDAGKVSLIAGVTKDLTNRVKAGDVIGHVGAQVGAKGGGRPDMARAGGGDKPDAVPVALASVVDYVESRLGES